MRAFKYFVNAADKFKSTPFLGHNNKDYNAYLELNRVTFFISLDVAKNMQANNGVQLCILAQCGQNKRLKPYIHPLTQWIWQVYMLLAHGNGTS